MADAQASGACYGNIVWVQVPSSAVKAFSNVQHLKGLFLFVFIQHPGKMIKIRTGELAHRDVFDHFPGADKARSASERPQSRMRSIWDVEC